MIYLLYNCFIGVRIVFKYVISFSLVLLRLGGHQKVKMINIAGVISIILFYVLILAVGIWAGRKKPPGNDSEEEVMLAGRSIGLFVGIFTMTGEAKCRIIF